MYKLIVIIFASIAILATNKNSFNGWIILGIPFVYLIFNAQIVKKQRWNPVAELSQSANELIQQYGFYYSYPFAAKDLYGASNIVAISGVILAIFNVMQEFYYGIPIAVLNWLAMGFTAKIYMPVANFQFDNIERIAHEEILLWIQEKRNKPPENT